MGWLKIGKNDEDNDTLVVLPWHGNGADTVSVFHGVGLTGVTDSAVANFLGIEPHCTLNRPSRLRKPTPYITAIYTVSSRAISLHRSLFNASWKLFLSSSSVSLFDSSFNASFYLFTRKSMENEIPCSL